MNTQQTSQKIECPRCEAKGFIQGFEHIANGQCFLCAGNKYITYNQLLSNPRIHTMLTYSNGGLNNLHPKIQLHFSITLETEKGCHELLEIYYHNHTFTCFEKARTFLAKIEQAGVDFEHIKNSPHWVQN